MATDKRDLAQLAYEQIIRQELDEALNRALRRIDPNVNGDLAAQIFHGSTMANEDRNLLVGDWASMMVEYFEQKKSIAA